MASSILSVFSSSERNYLKKLLKEPEKDFEEIISILDKKVQENTKQFIELDEKYKSIIDGLTQVGIGIDIVNKDYRVLFQNQVLKERFGDFQGKKCYSNYIGLKNPCELCPMEEALKYNRVERCELDGVDGRSYELISAPYPNQDGTIDKVVEIVIDITDRKKAEKKIKESEEKYRYFIENSIEGVWVVDEDANTILINPSMTKMLGYTKDEMIGKSVFDFMVEESAELTRLHLEQRKKGISEEGDAIMIHKGGNYINLRIRATPIFSKEGNYEGTYAFLTDVTNQKLAEQKLKESEEKYRILTEQSFLGLAILQDDWVIYVNKTLAHMFGYTVEEVMAWEKGGFINMIHPEYVKLVAEQANKKQLGELDVINQYQFKGIKKNGDILWLEVYSKTIIYKGKPADFVSIHDITDMKISEKKLRESEIRYQHLFNNFPISVSIFDLEGNLVESNRVIIKKLAEYINIDFVGQNFIDIIPHFQNANQLLRIFTERLNFLREGKALEPIDFLIITKSGKKVWLHWQSSRIEINNELFLQVLIQDITEKKEAEERLKESEEKFRNISEQSLIGI
ncbi:MAG: PAS domain-containing protein, partial [Promethearchaeota archaeon]